MAPSPTAAPPLPRGSRYVDGVDCIPLGRRSRQGEDFWSSKAGQSLHLIFLVASCPLTLTLVTQCPLFLEAVPPPRSCSPGNEAVGLEFEVKPPQRLHAARVSEFLGTLLEVDTYLGHMAPCKITSQDPQTLILRPSSQGILRRDRLRCQRY